ncbi:hypothetical protein Sango_2878000 [Sesamum angolense]|uniref:Uncharacterized protein n=1 Tax=Sesamum angolense TaxID=2727404 RepID=A0AAE1T675_9LAMI|nr:hypothetical protein Sango_2878000 [Sesamum angolense]
MDLYNCNCTLSCLYVYGCRDICNSDYDNVVETQLDSPMPWIGMYIAAASAVCSVAMIVDVFSGFRSKKFWLPCKYFSLNAFSLTVLAVAMKLPVDFTSKTLGVNDKLARLAAGFYVNCYGNFMTSLGSMEDYDIVLNLAALGVLVITVAGNVCIHIAQMRVFLDVRNILAEEIGSTVFMLLLLVTLCSSALMVPTAKRYIESGSWEPPICGRTIGNLRYVRRMCLLMALTLLEAQIRMPLVWLIAVQFKSSKLGHRSFKEEFKVETYWTQRLVDWRDGPLRLQIRHHKCRKLVHDAKRLLLNFCIAVQIVIVLASKLVLLISAPCVYGILLCFQCIKNLKSCDSSESRAGTELDFSHYVLLLEGEPGLPKKILTNICSEADKLIQKGKKKQPKNIIKLLRDRIAISLPNIENHKIKQLLLCAVSEGLSFVKLIEKTLYSNGELESLRNTADVVWVGVELYKKWQDKDLQVTSPKGITHKEMLQRLSSIAEKTVRDFIYGRDDVVMQNPLNWLVKVIASDKQLFF